MRNANGACRLPGGAAPLCLTPRRRGLRTFVSADLLADYSTGNATLIEASTADFWMYPTALGLAATAFFTAAESGSCIGGTPRLVKRIRDQIALTCALSRP